MSTNKLSEFTNSVIANLRRAELQRLCKTYGIRANTKNTVMVRELEKLVTQFHNADTFDDDEKHMPLDSMIALVNDRRWMFEHGSDSDCDSNSNTNNHDEDELRNLTANAEAQHSIDVSFNHNAKVIRDRPEKEDDRGSAVDMNESRIHLEFSVDTQSSNNSSQDYFENFDVDDNYSSASPERQLSPHAHAHNSSRTGSALKSSKSPYAMIHFSSEDEDDHDTDAESPDAFGGGGSGGGSGGGHERGSASRLCRLSSSNVKKMPMRDFTNASSGSSASMSGISESSVLGLSPIKKTASTKVSKKTRAVAKAARDRARANTRAAARAKADLSCKLTLSSTVNSGPLNSVVGSLKSTEIQNMLEDESSIMEESFRMESIANNSKLNHSQSHQHSRDPYSTGTGTGTAADHCHVCDEDIDVPNIFKTITQSIDDLSPPDAKPIKQQQNASASHTHSHSHSHSPRNRRHRRDDEHSNDHNVHNTNHNNTRNIQTIDSNHNSNHGGNNGDNTSTQSTTNVNRNRHNSNNSSLKPNLSVNPHRNQISFSTSSSPLQCRKSLSNLNSSNIEYQYSPPNSELRPRQISPMEKNQLKKDRINRLLRSGTPSLPVKKHSTQPRTSRKLRMSAARNPHTLYRRQKMARQQTRPQREKSGGDHHNNNSKHSQKNAADMDAFFGAKASSVNHSDADGYHKKYNRGFLSVYSRIPTPCISSKTNSNRKKQRSHKKSVKQIGGKKRRLFDITSAVNAPASDRLSFHDDADTKHGNNAFSININHDSKHKQGLAQRAKSEEQRIHAFAIEPEFKKRKPNVF